MMHQPVKTRTVALVVDTPFRDLPGLILVAWRLCQAGITCYLVPMNLLAREIWGLRPDLVLINYLRINNQKVVRHLMNAGFTVVVLDTEGGVFSPVSPSVRDRDINSETTGELTSAFEEYSLTMASDRETRNRIVTFCAWSKPFAEYAIRRNWYRSDQVVVTGPPRIDFYSSRWRVVAAKVAAKSQGNFQEPIVLINGSFPLANPRFQSRVQEVELMVKCFGYSRDFVQKWQDTQQQAMEGLVAVANHLAQSFPDIGFIYRPHPFESDEFYHTAIAELPNLHVIKKGTVDGWLLRSKALIHWGSSTALEAGFAGIPALTCGWLPVHLPIPDLDAVSVRNGTVSELTRCLDGILKGRFSLPIEVEKALKRSIDRTFFKCDGRAHDRVAETILRALESRREPKLIDWISYLVHGFAIPGGYFWREGMKRLLLRLRGTAPKPWHLSEKYFDAGTVKNYLAAIQRVDVGGDRRPVDACSANECRAYRFQGVQGASVVVSGASVSDD